MLGLTYIRKLNDMSQASLASILNISRQAVHKLENSKMEMPEQRLEQLEEVFGLPKEYFTKELDESDQLEIQKIKLQQSSKYGKKHDIIEKYDKEIIKTQYKQKMNEIIDILTKEDTKEEFLIEVTTSLKKAKSQKEKVEVLEELLQDYKK